MIGWKRIVVTVGEKIGKDHLTYGQGAAAEITTMFTIGAADCQWRIACQAGNAWKYLGNSCFPLIRQRVLLRLPWESFRAIPIRS
jgi:hypothetical protein